VLDCFSLFFNGMAGHRLTIAVPHPERVCLNIQMIWTSLNRCPLGQWIEICRKAKRWVG
jgi:hypothetical protein